MSGRRAVVVGGDAAGMSAASQMRRTDPTLEVLVLEKGDFVSYGACGMPYYIAGEIAKAEDLLVSSPEEFAARGIDVRCGYEVKEVRAGARVLVGETAAGQSFSERFDYLVLATGGKAVVPTVPGADLAGVHTLRSLNDGIALREVLDRGRVRRAVIVGAGFIGLELAEALAKRGVQVQLLTRSERLLNGFERPFAQPLFDELFRHGTELIVGEQVEGIEGRNGQVVAVSTDKGRYAADLVLLATGLEPGAELARSAGIALGQSGAIAVNDRMKTDVVGIWAAGDCIEVKHVVTGEPVYAPLALTANRTGRIAGDNVGAQSAGKTSSQRFRGTAGTLIAKVFGFTAAQTGLTLLEAERAGFSASVFTRQSRTRARYYPGAESLWSRIVVDRTTRRLLGAQVLSREGVAGRIDVFATALFNRMSIDEIYDLDLAYAPPYGPVYDPVIDICGHAMLQL
jgi:NADPH-dependent 2,4-dienoyl-CoA reductase/sulfur reductase-like enzyme